MVKKAGRPAGSQNKVGKDQKEFIRQLLSETQEEFRQAFLGYAQSQDKNVKSKFVNLSIEMSKMIVPKPIEADFNLSESNFKKLIGICSKWDDDV
jgi:hypothetical protein